MTGLLTEETLRARKQRRVRRQIVDAAYALFAERGYSAVSVDDIADAAEVSRSTFFRYFGDKEEVVFSATSRLRDRLMTSAGRLDASPADTLDAALRQVRPLVDEIYEVASSSPRWPLHRQLIADNPELSDRHLRRLSDLADELAQLLHQRGTSIGLSELAAQLAVACCLAGERLSDAAAEDVVAAIDAQFELLRCRA